MLSSPALTPKALPPPHPKMRSCVSRALLCALPISSLLLGLQASSPLSGSWHALNFVNWLLLGLFFLGTGALFRDGDSVTRLTVALVLTALLHLLTITDWFQFVSTDHLASRLAARLSETWGGMPLAALFQGWSALCVGWLSYQALSLTFSKHQRLLRFAVVGVPVFTALVGVRAVIGYVTGNTSLFAG